MDRLPSQGSFPDGLRVSFDPPRQVLHGPRKVRLIIDDPRGIREGYRLKIRYGGHDVTQSALLQAKVREASSGKRLVVEIPRLRLAPTADHDIEVGYRDALGRQVVSRYPAPVCRAFGKGQVRGTEAFRPSEDLLRSVRAIAVESGFNPAFATGLIAEESAFDTRSVSIARALGLTQVTPIAEEEVSKLYTQWPRYPGVNGLPAPVLKLLVMTGKLNPSNEWRLDPERSIRGGLAFVRQLGDRWLDSEGLSRVRWSGEGPGAGENDEEVARTRLMLASYHSGFARVAGAVRRLGPEWLNAPELKGAHRYVNRIFSYCDAFGREPSEVDREDST